MNIILYSDLVGAVTVHNGPIPGEFLARGTPWYSDLPTGSQTRALSNTNRMDFVVG